MEEDSLQNLFDNFNPELSSDDLFMNKLQKNLDSVELIRQYDAQLKVQSRKAVVIAAVVGFIVGVLLTLSLPYLGLTVSHLQLQLHESSLLRMLIDNYRVFVWLIIGGTSVVTAVNTYEMALSLFKRQTI